MTDLLARHRAVLPSWVDLYYDQPLELVSGSGRRVTDAAGRTYLDFFAGILTTMLGHDVPEVRQAVERQLRTGIVHTSTLYLIRSQVELAERIAVLSGIPDAKVFFTTSGTEATDLALLLATSYRRSNQILAMRNSYHGRSFAAVGVTGNRGWSPSSLAPVSVSYLHGTDRAGFPGWSDEQYMDFCVQDLRRVLATTTSGDVACLIAEPVQGVGGFTMPPDGLYGRYKEVLDEHGILFSADEVQTGWGRTGDHFWGYQAHGMTPDIMTVAKGLGNGYSIGAVVARAEVMDAMPAKSISTFGGNPVAMTAAQATLDYLLSHPLQANARQVGAMLREGLAGARDRCPIVGDVRGKGLMIGVDLVRPGTGEPDPAAAAAVLEEARERGLLIGKGGLYGNALRIAPPLTLTEEEAKEGLDILLATVEAVAGRAER